MTGPQPLLLPPFVRTVADARAFAYVAHKGQSDKAGRPYTTHLVMVHERLVDKLPGLPQDQWDEAQQIAWLHDVAEDTPYNTDHLRREGFSAEVCFGVEHLTHDPHDRRLYADRIAALCRCAPLPVLLVKLSDNEDNADSARLAKLDEVTRDRLLRKYGPSMAMLREAAWAKGWREQIPR